MLTEGLVEFLNGLFVPFNIGVNDTKGQTDLDRNNVACFCLYRQAGCASSVPRGANLLICSIFA